MRIGRSSAPHGSTVLEHAPSCAFVVVPKTCARLRAIRRRRDDWPSCGVRRRKPYSAFATVRVTTTDRFTTTDLDRLDLPDGWRAEIIDGALYVSKASGWDHQGMIVRLLRVLGDWVDEHGGAVNAGIGVLYADDDNVIRDVVWISAERLAKGLDAAGHLNEPADASVCRRGAPHGTAAPARPRRSPGARGRWPTCAAGHRSPAG